MNAPPESQKTDNRKRHWRLVGPLLAVHGTVAVATVAGMGTALGGGDELLTFLLMSLATAQGSLLGIWVALGGPPTPWRLIGAVVTLVGLMWVLYAAFPGSGVEVWAYFMLAQSLATSLPLLALRFRGLAVALPDPDDSAPQMQKLQFSLRSLLEWTTALAVLLGTLQMTTEEFQKPFTSWQGLAEIGALLCADALLALAALWMALGARSPGARMLMLGLVLVGSAFAIASTLDDSLLLTWIPLFVLLSTLWLIASLWVFRVLGYRLIWRRTVRL